MRFLSLWLPRFSTDLLIRRRPALAGLPLVTTHAQRGRLTLTGLSASAEAQGLHIGMPLADARALLPEIEAVSQQPGEEARFLGRLADWADRYTPLVARDPPDGLMLDITGCAHLFAIDGEVEGEAALLHDLLDRLTVAGFAARGAVADSPAAAWALARYGVEDAAIAAAGDQRHVLAGLPVAALRLEAATVEGLQRLGLRRIGDLYPLPRASLRRRFGKALAHRLDQALGLAAEPITPRRPAPVYAERRGFAEPVTDREAITAAVHGMAEALCARLEADDLGARHLCLSAYRAEKGGDAVQRLSWGSGRPSRDTAHLMRLFAERLNAGSASSVMLDPGFGFDLLVLSATETDRPETAQTDWTDPGQGADADLTALIDRLQVRLGDDSVVRLCPRQSHLPERAVAVRPARIGLPHNAAGWPAHWQRPLCLLQAPEPVEAVAPVPDDPPVLFRWRGRVHRVRRAEGPERLEPEWWHAGARAAWRTVTPQTRDYYRIEDQEGRRFWLFRAGLYAENDNAEPAATPPSWHLHGFFA